MKILIADDQLMYRRLARAALEPAGHEISEVDNGLAAWELLEGAERPSLAMVDWMMPGLTGPEVCRKVRGRADASPPYLILVTGQGRPEDIVAGLEAGADDYITKPFNPAELQARVQVGVRILELRTALGARVIALEEALAQVQQLQGLLPMCAWCKKIRDEKNYWQQVEQYIAGHTKAQFTHSICPQCRDTIVRPKIEAMRGKALS